VVHDASSRGGRKNQIYPVIVKLPELHRPTAQHGCFLHSNLGWYEILQPDCIIFPISPHT
jgi:hypothetical protein